jgi:type I restriction enzyme S subunit
VSEVAIGEICELINGRAFKPSDWSATGLPIVRIQNLNSGDAPFNRYAGKVRDRFLIDSGALLFSWSGTPGTSFGAFFWQRGPAILNQHIFHVLPRNGIDKNYLRYALNGRIERIIAQAHGGVGLQHITKDKLEATTIPIPPLSEQRRVAGILDKADAIRRKRNESITLTEKLLRSAFLEMFGDPVTNPKGWKIAALEELVDERRGISYGIVQRGSDAQDGVPVVRISNLASNRFDGSHVVRASAAISDSYRRTVLRGDEIVVSIRGTVGRVAVVPPDARGWNVSREVAVIPLLNHVSRPLVHRALLSEGVQRFILGNVKGVAQSGINLSDLRQAPIPLPPIAKVERFDQFVRTVSDVERRLTVASTDGDMLFDSLVSRAFSDKLRMALDAHLPRPGGLRA